MFEPVTGVLDLGGREVVKVRNRSAPGIVYTVKRAKISKATGAQGADILWCDCPSWQGQDVPPGARSCAHTAAVMASLMLQPGKDVSNPGPGQLAVAGQADKWRELYRRRRDAVDAVDITMMGDSARQFAEPSRLLPLPMAGELMPGWLAPYLTAQALGQVMPGPPGSLEELRAVLLRIVLAKVPSPETIDQLTTVVLAVASSAQSAVIAQRGRDAIGVTPPEALEWGPDVPPRKRKKTTVGVVDGERLITLEDE